MPTDFPILAVLLASLASLAQQSPQQPQPTQPQPAQAQPATASTVPCIKGASNPPHKQGWLEKKARTLACAKNKNLCDLPSSTTETTGGTPEAKPCPTNAPPKQVAPSTPQPPPAANLVVPSAPADNDEADVCLSTEVHFDSELPLLPHA